MNNSRKLQIFRTYKYWWLFDDETQNVDQWMEYVFHVRLSSSLSGPQK